MDIKKIGLSTALPTRLLTVTLAIACLALALAQILQPIVQNDTWWHLKTGDWIIANRSLPSSDPFTYSHHLTGDTQERFLLTAYWVSQIVLSIALKFGGFFGIAIYRAVVLGILAVVLFQRLQRRGVQPWLSFTLLISASLCLFWFYPGLERPQVLSFLFASVLMGMVEEIREGKGPSWLMPPMMTLWANCHGGFIVGDLLLCAVVVGAAWTFRKDRQHFFKISRWAAAGLCFSLCNPNGYFPFLSAFQLSLNRELMDSISEFKGSIEAFHSGYPQIAVFWVLLFLMLVAAVASGRFSCLDFFPMMLSGALAFRYCRNIAFFMVAMAPLSGYYLKHAMERWATRPVKAVLVLGALALITVVPLTLSQVKWEETILNTPDKRYPSAAVDFLQRQELKGAMLNDYDAGGYLIWKLSPDRKVLIDGRIINLSILRDYRTIQQARTHLVNGRPAWSQLLDSYDIQYVIQYLQQPSTGELQPLMRVLLNDPQWAPVYVDQIAYIFVRRDGLNASVAQQFEIPPLLFCGRILESFDSILHEHPTEVKALLGRGEMFAYLGRIDEGKRNLDAALRLSPKNMSIQSRMIQLRMLERDG
ncbi:hypothetical protein KI809_08140 [Geobacter pelophilus]|uniref:Tetratricopeptide repeat protein n=1 Tax=Geoanaerobacter pelophilus TaxID=60036 RepID=A0AAW4L8B3_9BACT|nr:hypothetical protein [Geoanaerobacter pelophilus]MBT0664269.1 hypothetical protein [Geoanaerobacter pelophilus]